VVESAYFSRPWGPNMKCRRFRSGLKTSRVRGRVRRFLQAPFGLCLSLLLLVGIVGCRHPASATAPVTITLLDPGWLDKKFLVWRAHEEEDFTRETGIIVKDFPAPETAIDQLALLRKLLQSSTDAPDVFAIDVIWPTVTAQYSLNLNPYLADTAQDFPNLVANDTVDGKLVALPYHADAGLLFYRSDLLREYGYRAPPATWDELEQMAARIQKGERAKGNQQFWGYVWQGAPSEGLTCNALEWQASEGGGQIIETDRKISVNNPAAVHSWERAARWVGSISPPSVIAYREWDALNIWSAGNAAFMRNWPAAYLTSQGPDSMVREKSSATMLPGGRSGHVGTLGGASLSVFRNSRHPVEAVALVRYLCRRDVERARSMATAQPAVMPMLYDIPEVAKSLPHFADLKEVFHDALAVRPSTVTGTRYGQVSEAYFESVHAVLTKQKRGAQAAADLEKELVRITGLPSSDRSEGKHGN
jgi:trehalose/maltose transport system substrate-binding protein